MDKGTLVGTLLCQVCLVGCSWDTFVRGSCQPLGECLPGARPARYLSINYPDFSPRFTL